MSKGKARSVEPVYISAGCNRYSNVADVNQHGLVAYGAGKLVALWNSEVLCLLALHNPRPCSDVRMSRMKARAAFMRLFLAIKALLPLSNS
jgi:hypothetical protein